MIKSSKGDLWITIEKVWEFNGKIWKLLEKNNYWVKIFIK